MKRNTLMKRLAVAALAATMTVGMAVPTFAGVQATYKNGSYTADAGTAGQHIQTATYVDDDLHTITQWFKLKDIDDEVKLSFANAWLENGSLKFDTSIVKNRPDADFGLTRDGKLYVNGKYEEDTSNTYKAGQYYEELSNAKVKQVQVSKGGTFQISVGDTEDTGYYVVWTVTPENDNYFDAKVEDNELTLNANNFGTTVFEYTGKLYHNGKYVGTEDGDTKGYFAVTLPLNKTTIEDVVDDALEVTPDAAPTADKAANAGKKSIEANFEKWAPKIIEVKDVTKLGDNKDHTLEAVVDDVKDFHAGDSFKAHVTIKDTTEDKHTVEYDLGTKTFKIVGSTGSEFSDVTSDKYYYDAVEWGADEGVLKGYEDGTFKPYNTLTREQVALMLYRYNDSPVTNTDKITERFSDVGNLSTESKKAIAWGVNEGIIKGTSDTTFSPKASITRAQLVTMLYRDSDDYDENNAEFNEDSDFTDVAHRSFYEDAVNWAVSKGVTTGTSDTTFSPNEETTRAQGITFLYRYDKL